MLLHAFTPAAGITASLFIQGFGALEGSAWKEVGARSITAVRRAYDHEIPNHQHSLVAADSVH